jgi:hypothetical protein
MDENQQFDHYIIVELKVLEIVDVTPLHTMDVGLLKDEEYNN